MRLGPKVFARSDSNERSEIRETVLVYFYSEGPVQSVLPVFSPQHVRFVFRMECRRDVEKKLATRHKQQSCLHSLLTAGCGEDLKCMQFCTASTVHEERDRTPRFPTSTPNSLG